MNEFHFDFPGDCSDFLDQWHEKVIRRRTEYLEAQAKLFLAMGFTAQELMIVQDVDGNDPQVVPHLISTTDSPQP